MKNSNWPVIVLIITMIGLLFLVLINRNEKEIETKSLSSFQIDSIKFENSMKVLIAEMEKRFEEQTRLQESYQKGFEAGLNALQREDAYNRGYEESKSIFKADADYYRNELNKFIENYGKETLVDINSIPNNDESVVEIERNLGIYEVSDLYSKGMTSSEIDTIYYSDYLNNLEKRNILFGFTSDLSVGLTDGNPAEITSWNYIGFNYLRPSEGADYELLFGYSGNQYRLKFVAECFRINDSYSMYFTDQVTWNKHHEYNSSLALSLGIEKKWKNSPLSVYGEVGGVISNDLSPYFEIGARINFSKKILEF